MSLLVLDDVAISVKKTPNGFALRIAGDNQVWSGVSLLIPLEGEAAHSLYQAIGDILKHSHKVIAADKIQMEREVHRHGQ